MDEFFVVAAGAVPDVAGEAGEAEVEEAEAGEVAVEEVEVGAATFAGAATGVVFGAGSGTFRGTCGRSITCAGAVRPRAIPWATTRSGAASCATSVCMAFWVAWRATILVWIPAMRTWPCATIASPTTTTRRLPATRVTANQMCARRDGPLRVDLRGSGSKMRRGGRRLAGRAWGAAVARRAADVAVGAIRRPHRGC